VNREGPPDTHCHQQLESVTRPAVPGSCRAWEATPVGPHRDPASSGRHTASIACEFAEYVRSARPSWEMESLGGTARPTTIGLASWVASLSFAM
jgi:hypothetical protein